MPESQEHIALVKRILDYIRKEYSSVGTLYMTTDLSGDTSSRRPPNINGYVPDVFCTNTPASMTVIGEAKTSKDLQTHRSLEQIAAFYNHLTYVRGGHLVIGVPWSNEAFVFNFLKHLQSKIPDNLVDASIVSEMGVLQCF